MTMFPAERMQVISAILDVVSCHPQRYEIEWYVWKCKDAGFVHTKQDIHNVVNRWLAGKRKITPPGTKKNKKLEKEKKKGIPQDIKQVVLSILEENKQLVNNYKQGQDKALNVLVGRAIKATSYAPALLKEYIQWNLFVEKTLLTKD